MSAGAWPTLDQAEARELHRLLELVLSARLLIESARGVLSVDPDGNFRRLQAAGYDARCFLEAAARVLERGGM